MKLVIASDHAGFELKQTVLDFVGQELGLGIEDLGTHSRESCDFPGYAVAVARAVVGQKADLGILICGTGIGMCITANKIRGAKAALCADCFTAWAARAHNDANILCLGGRVVGPGLATQIVRAFVTTDRDDAERLARRRRQITDLESGVRGEDA